jgi:TPP-dependent pyruvate/acetoin dehydrogenase alpha subunit
VTAITMLVSHRFPRRCLSFAKRPIPEEVLRLPEYIQRENFLLGLRTGNLGYEPSSDEVKRYMETVSNPATTGLLLDSILATFLLHVQARIASCLGKGFYTIGPCGEETLAAVGLCLRETDASALHYRHVGTEVARQLSAGIPIENIMLDRARGYTCSVMDPVTGGRHCAIGGHPFSYLVTSTLASQGPPAVGRALAIPLVKKMGVRSAFTSDSISFVTVGDGSVNNAHFLAALNTAEYAQHTSRKCPVVFGVSDNGICISLKGYNWIDKFISKSLLQQYVADANDVADVMFKTNQAFEFSRQLGRPSIILYKNIKRRFGHAATDRQNAYMTQSQIEGLANNNNLARKCPSAALISYCSFNMRIY